MHPPPYIDDDETPEFVTILVFLKVQLAMIGQLEHSVNGVSAFLVVNWVIFISLEELLYLYLFYL